MFGDFFVSLEYTFYMKNYIKKILYGGIIASPIIFLAMYFITDNIESVDSQERLLFSSIVVFVSVILPLFFIIPLVFFTPKLIDLIKGVGLSDDKSKWRLFAWKLLWFMVVLSTSLNFIDISGWVKGSLYIITAAVFFFAVGMWRRDKK